MTKSQLGLLGSVLAAGALAIAGCGGGGGGGGTGGKADGGTGGKGTGGGTVPGTGGKVDGGSAGTTGTDGGTDIRADAGTGGSDARTDTGPADTGPCVTSFGSGNRTLFAFDYGANTNWAGGVESDPSGSNLANSLSLGGTTTDGDSCPGAVTLTIPFMGYNQPDAGGITQVVFRYTGYYGNPLDWTGHSKLHMSIKVVTTGYAALGNIQAFAGLISTATPTTYGYASTDTGGIANADWMKVVIDLSAQSPAAFRINELGLRVQLKTMAPAGGPAVPPTMEVRLDDIWLEAAPPPDAAPDVQPDVPVDTGVDAPAVDTGVDVAPADTGVDATTG